MITETDTNANNNINPNPLMTTIGMKKRLRIGFWNVRSMLETTKLAQIEKEFIRYNMLLLGLSEVRWPDSGELQTSNGLTLVYAGRAVDQPRSSGVGFLLSKEAKKSLIEWQPHTDRIIVARFRTRARNLTCIQCYAPTEAAEDVDKNAFYEKLSQVINNISHGDIKILMGDFNAQVGCDNTSRESVMGMHGTGRMTDNGERLVELCENFNMVLGGTLFPHKKIHKCTWVSPDHTTENQIDHFAISRMWRGSLLDVRNKRGADVGSDHHLIVAEVRLKVKAVNRKPTLSRRRLDLQKLNHREVATKFSEGVSNRTALMDISVQNIDTYWKDVKTAYIETAVSEIGYEAKLSKPWISNNTWQLIEARRQAKGNLNEAKTLQSKQQCHSEYQQLNRAVKSSAREDKRRWADKLAKEAQVASETGRPKDLYRITKEIAGHNHHNTKPLINEQGDMIYSKEEQMVVWEGYYEKLLSAIPADSCKICDCDPMRHTNNVNNDFDPSPPTSQEIAAAIRRLKSGKSAGPDGISPELLKADTALSTKLLQPLITKYWADEKLPHDLREGLIIKLPKKGNLHDCSNWRGITLLNMVNKVIAHILHNRIATIVEPHLRREQAGFRPDKSCIDHINSLRVIVEQSVEWRSPLYLVFVDFKRAFDTLEHTAIWEALRCKGVPEKIIRLIKELYCNAFCCVLHEGAQSKPISVKIGVRQGCVLSPLLFNIVLDVVMSQSMSGQHGISWGLHDRLDDIDYADDVCLFSHRFSSMQSKIETFASRAALAGLQININKTKSMRINSSNDTKFHLAGQPIDEVETFCYLGSIISKSGGSREDIQNRLCKAKQAFGMLNKFWRSQNISTNTKLKVFNTNVKAVLLYGCETWNISSREMCSLQAFVNRCLRRILKIFWPVTISNQDLWLRTDQNPIQTSILTRKYGWLGHTMRKAANDINRQAVEYNPQGSRRPGRPANTWRRQTENELKEFGVSWNEMKVMTSNKDSWKTFVEALCSSRN